MTDKKLTEFRALATWIEEDISFEAAEALVSLCDEVEKLQQQNKEWRDQYEKLVCDNCGGITQKLGYQKLCNCGD